MPKKVQIKLDKEQIREKLKDEKLGKFVAHEWHRLMLPYTPRNTGMLYRSVKYRSYKIHYYQKYANYMYEGKVYVDPVTGSPWARKNVRKIPTSRTFAYRKSMSPFAADHWDIVAEKAGQKNKLYHTINNALRSGKF